MSQTILVVDIETTRFEERSIPSSRKEIIEIGAVWVTLEGETIATFRSFARPRAYPALTDVCKRETGISQAEVDGASPFPVVAARLSVFTRQHASDTAYWVTWGGTGLRRLMQESERYEIACPIILPHMNAKRLFAKHQNLAEEVGLRKACFLTRLGDVPGAHHRALNDAMAIAWLLPWVFGDRQLGKTPDRTG